MTWVKSIFLVIISHSNSVLAILANHSRLWNKKKGNKKCKNSVSLRTGLFLFYSNSILNIKRNRSSNPEVFLEKGVLKIYSKFIGEHPCRSAISIKLICNFIEIVPGHGCSPVNLLLIFRTPFLNNTSGRLLLEKHSQLPEIYLTTSAPWKETANRLKRT